jgi:hypothetical protein
MIAHSHLPAGIDKIVLTTREYRVTDTKPLNIQPVMKFAGQLHSSDAENLLFHSQGEPVFGSKAFVNTDRFQANINCRGLNITFNPSKLLHEYELLTEHDKLQEVCRSLEKELSEHCIMLNPFESKISRLDIAKQELMPRLVSHYAPAFDQMTFKGVRSTNVNHGAETFSVRNKTVEVSFYDKQKEMNPSGMPSNFLRAELRLRKSDGVSRYAGLSSLGQLIEMKQEGWEYVYSQYMSKKIFTQNIEQLSFDYAGLDTLVRYLVENNPQKRGHIASAIQTIGVNQIFDNIGVDRFLSAFTPYLDGSTIRRARAKLKELAHLSQLIGTPVNTLDLIKELQETFINDKAA